MAILDFSLSMAGGLLLWLVPLSLKAPRPVVGLSLVLSVVAFGNGAAVAYQWDSAAVLQRQKRTIDQEIQSHEMATLGAAAMEAITAQYFSPVEAIAVDEQGDQHRGGGRKSIAMLPASQPIDDKGLLSYLRGLGAKFADEHGWFSVSELHQKWAKNRGMNASQFKELLQLLTSEGYGSFSPDQKLWLPR